MRGRKEEKKGGKTLILSVTVYFFKKREGLKHIVENINMFNISGVLIGKCYFLYFLCLKYFMIKI